jgi:hypothetical protein
MQESGNIAAPFRNQQMDEFGCLSLKKLQTKIMKYFGFRPSGSSHTPDRYVWLRNRNINHAEKLENS